MRLLPLKPLRYGKALRRVAVPVDVAAVRKRMGLKQKSFAAIFGVSLATLRHWEHGDRKPTGPALVLLNVIDRNPRAILATLKVPLHPSRRSGGAT